VSERSKVILFVFAAFFLGVTCGQFQASGWNIEWVFTGLFATIVSLLLLAGGLWVWDNFGIVRRSKQQPPTASPGEGKDGR
jgi:hypothetical protein